MGQKGELPAYEKTGEIPVSSGIETPRVRERKLSDPNFAQALESSRKKTAEIAYENRIAEIARGWKAGDRVQRLDDHGDLVDWEVTRSSHEIDGNLTLSAKYPDGSERFARMSPGDLARETLAQEFVAEADDKWAHAFETATALYPEAAVAVDAAKHSLMHEAAEEYLRERSLNGEANMEEILTRLLVAEAKHPNAAEPQLREMFEDDEQEVTEAYSKDVTMEYAPLVRTRLPEFEPIPDRIPWPDHRETFEKPETIESQLADLRYQLDSNERHIAQLKHEREGLRGKQAHFIGRDLEHLNEEREALRITIGGLEKKRDLLLSRMRPLQDARIAEFDTQIDPIEKAKYHIEDGAQEQFDSLLKQREQLVLDREAMEPLPRPVARKVRDLAKTEYRDVAPEDARNIVTRNFVTEGYMRGDTVDTSRQRPSKERIASKKVHAEARALRAQEAGVRETLRRDGSSETRRLPKAKQEAQRRQEKVEDAWFATETPDVYSPERKALDPLSYSPGYVEVANAFGGPGELEKLLEELQDAGLTDLTVEKISKAAPRNSLRAMIPWRNTDDYIGRITKAVRQLNQQSGVENV